MLLESTKIGWVFQKDLVMRYVAPLLLIAAAPSVLSLPMVPSLPFVPESSSLMLLIAGLLGVAVIRRRQG